MRKVISLGLMALIFSLFSTHASAGNVEECEKLASGEFTKGLYGLCIAYHNAGNENARNRIRDNYDKKAGPGDPPLVVDAECPCWDAGHLADASLNGTPSACLLTSEGDVYDLAFYTSSPAFYQFYADTAGCFRVDPNGTQLGAAFESPDATEREVCIAGIETLIEDDFAGINCNGVPQ
ncbi:MAG: hypothetical protein HKN57_00080 [Xanthomonadales bacterium]|nr:hypothetical protein [Gammaproteobacteria bacterium]MBT8052411.1 hypothetical protein [Gammaproteobacteria bacterium]NND55624.1 hypothetical protein [Xanthomonadales bacterium]NNK50507.1 hypothetical protein [Xanthomonadales bacterium]